MDPDELIEEILAADSDEMAREVERRAVEASDNRPTPEDPDGEWVDGEPEE